MLTEDLHEALEHASAQPPFTPSMSAVLSRRRQLRLRRRLIMATSVVAVGGLVAGLAIGLTGNAVARRTEPAIPSVGLGGYPVPTTPDQLVAAYAQWGPTRGDLRDNSAFTTRALDAWEKPFDDDAPPWQAFPGPRALAGSPHVLYAGRTPDGVAAVVTQPSSDQYVKMFIGILVGSSPDSLRLVGEEDSNSQSYPALDPDGTRDTSWYSGNEVGGFGGELSIADPHVLSFATSASGSNAIILPINPHDSIQSAIGHRLTAAGQITRSFTAVPTYGGVGTLAVADDNIADAMIHVVHRGQLVDQSPVFADDPAGPPLPSNLLPNADRIEQAAGGEDHGVTLADSEYLWLRQRYGTRRAPYPSDPYGDRDFVSSTLRGPWIAQISQEWLPGDPAQTVVGVQRAATQTNQTVIVSDTITRPGADLVVADRLPHALGWLLLTGTKSTITGYRVPGDATWVVPAAAATPGISHHPGRTRTVQTRRTAVLHTNARTLQIRLRVNGRQVVVTRSS